MQSRLSGTVVEITGERRGIQEVRIQTLAGIREAVNYPPMTGRVKVGDSVDLNTCATSLHLGTGGVDFVSAVGGATEPEWESGHIIKLRYTPLQFPLLAAEAPESPFHDEVRSFTSLDAIPVVCAEIHSQIAAVSAAVKWETHDRAKVGYILTDGAALPLAFSRLLANLQDRGLIDVSISAGQAFGGDFEAVNVYSAMAIARAVAAVDVIIVSQGPGAAGTGTPLGFSGVEQGTALNAAASLGGTPVTVVRMSEADPRPRHRGISHHTLTVLQQIALCRALVPVPRPTREMGSGWRRAFEGTHIAERHDLITVDVEPAIKALQSLSELFTTMGRTMNEDRAFFEAAIAAGLVAGQIYNEQTSAGESIGR